MDFAVRTVGKEKTLQQLIAALVVVAVVVSMSVVSDKPGIVQYTIGRCSPDV